jgi:hypothetical protein
MDLNSLLDRVYRKWKQTGDFKELSGLHKEGVIITFVWADLTSKNGIIAVIGIMCSYWQ